MSNHLSSMLEAWAEARDDTDWVLGTVFRTEGSAYRKAGAMMLIGGQGQQLGLLSGGCLEADIARNARKAMVTGRALTLTYDGSDEDDLSFQLGIGCGGTVHIMLQPLEPENDLDLGVMARALGERRRGTYYQHIGGVAAKFVEDEDRGLNRSIVEDGWLVTPIRPEPHLLVVGGGYDARPVVSLARELGWRVTLADPRPANARPEYFPGAAAILRDVGPDLGRRVDADKVDAAVLMSHNIDLDARALASLQGTGLRHVALLGPRHRFHQVLERAGLSEHDLSCPVSGPAGLDIGGRLPESIALSILAECHSVLHRAQAWPARQMAAE